MLYTAPCITPSCPLHPPPPKIREIKALNGQLVRLEGWKRAERRQIRGELKQLYKEERARQEKAVKVGRGFGCVWGCVCGGECHG